MRMGGEKGWRGAMNHPIASPTGMDGYIDVKSSNQKSHPFIAGTGDTDIRLRLYLINGHTCHDADQTSRAIENSQILNADHHSREKHNEKNDRE